MSNEEGYQTGQTETRIIKTVRNSAKSLSPLVRSREIKRTSKIVGQNYTKEELASTIYTKEDEAEE